MRLYHVKGTVIGYDTYSDFVCAARTAEEARRNHPNGYLWAKGRGRVDEDAETVTVTEIGVAARGIEAGIICVSFRAG